MNKLSEYIQEIWSKSINSIDKETIYDIYVFSFYVYDNEDDPRRPTLTIGYNTNSNLKNKIINGLDKIEAKWNYAHWLQNEIAVIGNEDDEEGKLIISGWVTEIGLNYSHEEEIDDFETCLEKGEKITKNFIEILIEIVKESQNNKIITKPILIHELEYYEKIIEQNIEANGKERVIEFVNWIKEM